jgi:hypothetical protein
MPDLIVLPGSSGSLSITPETDWRERGDGKWRQIAWDEAFSITADALNRTKEVYGPEAVFMAHGSAKAFIDKDLVRLANAFGAPNVMSADHVCHVPRMLGAEFTFCFYPVPEMDHPPACIFAWGVNHAETRFYKYKGWLEAMDRGSRLIALNHTMNSFQVSCALSILMALTGDLDAPGGEIDLAGTGFRFGDTESSAVGIMGRWSYELELRDHIPREKRKNKIDPDLLPDFRYVPPHTAILWGDRYPL